MKDYIIYKGTDTNGLIENKQGYVFNYILSENRLIIKKLMNEPFEDVVIYDEEVEGFIQVGLQNGSFTLYDVIKNLVENNNYENSKTEIRRKRLEGNRQS